MFSLTPIEAAIWQAGVSAQSVLATKIFGSILFTSFIMVFFIKHALKIFSSSGEGAGPEDVLKQMGAYGIMVAIGLTFLNSLSSTAFSPKDGKGRSWSSYSYVRSSTKYHSLSEEKNGLYWYTLLHGATNELSKYMSSVVAGVFGDGIYDQAPDMMFKLLVNTASMQLDDPKITSKLDALMQDCSDPQKGKLLKPESSVGTILDLDKPGCLGKYQDMQGTLKSWASNKIPSYVKKVSETSTSELPYAVHGFSDKEKLENKIIGSALVSYAKEKSRGYKDEINTNVDALNITSKQDHFWYTMQKAASAGGFSSIIANLFMDSGEAESSINRNEARIIYNNLLNLIPSFKGLVKAFIAVSFLFGAAGLCFGFTKPMIWWLSIIAMDMVYEPLSTLNYEINALLLKSSEIGAAFGHLSHDPMAVMGAAIIDSSLIQYETAYFLSQTAIAALFVFGIIGSGFAVNKMSFAQGAGFTGLAGWISNNRMISSVGRGVGKGIVKVFKP